MSCGYYSMLCDQNATFTLSLYWNDANGDPIDLTGYTADMQVKASKEATAILVELSTTNGYITLGGATGQITLNIPDTVTAAFAAGNYVYDLLLTSGGTATRLIEGPFIVSASVTP